MEIQKHNIEKTELIQRLGNKFEPAVYEKVTGEHWPAKYSSMMVKDIKQVFEMSTPSIASIKKYKGADKTLVLIAHMIAELVDFFNVKNKMNEGQISLTSQLVLQEYYYLTIADFRLCFVNAMLGKYGEQYNRVDGAVVLKWLKLYAVNRKFIAQTEAISRAGEDKKANNVLFNDCDEETREKLKSLAVNMKSKLKNTKPEPKKLPETLKQWAAQNKKTDSFEIMVLTEIENYWIFLEIKPTDSEGNEITFAQFKKWMANGILHKLNKGLEVQTAIDKTLKGE